MSEVQGVGLERFYYRKVKYSIVIGCCLIHLVKSDMSIIIIHISFASTTMSFLLSSHLFTSSSNLCRYPYIHGHAKSHVIKVWACVYEYVSMHKIMWLKSEHVYIYIHIKACTRSCDWSLSMYNKDTFESCERTYTACWAARLSVALTKCSCCSVGSWAIIPYTNCKVETASLVNVLRIP